MLGSGLCPAPRVVQGPRPPHRLPAPPSVRTGAGRQGKREKVRNGVHRFEESFRVLKEIYISKMQGCQPCR
jgi:hypothetical protein